MAPEAEEPAEVAAEETAEAPVAEETRGGACSLV